MFLAMSGNHAVDRASAAPTLRDAAEIMEYVTHPAASALPLQAVGNLLVGQNVAGADDHFRIQFRMILKCAPFQ